MMKMNKEYIWNLSDLKKVPKNNLKVFSCFSCGGGSTMGYKLAGYDIIGNCEIDEKVNNLYVKNQHPKYNFCMDIRKFNDLKEYPEELYCLDILDGSPPCTSFSTAGIREKGWGKKKKFREGQKEQTLDDLFFEFIDVANKLKPKVIIAENVKGIILGKAKGYCNLILKAYERAGYDTQIFLLNSATMGVPQKRERIFFVSKRKDLDLPKLKLTFKERPVLFGEFRSERGKEINSKTDTYRLLQLATKKDKNIADINLRLYNKLSQFNASIVQDTMLVNTITAGGSMYRFCDKMAFSDKDIITAQTFPQDYNFYNSDAKYVCGMSVPPLMMKKIAEQVYLQWFKNLNEENKNV